MPATRKTAERLVSSGPSPMTKDMTARTTATEVPRPAKTPEAADSRWASQPGSPEAALPSAPESAPWARLTGSNHSTPMPVHKQGPHGLAAPYPQQAFGGGRTGGDLSRTNLGPDQQPDDGVEQGRAGRAAQGRGVAGQQHAEALAHRPHPEGPDEGDHQGRLDRLADQQTGPDQQLHAGEQRVHQGRLHRHEVGHMGDGARHGAGLPLGRGHDDHVGEARPEHLGLELQEAVEQPHHAQPDLDVARRDARARRAGHAWPRMMGAISARVRSASN